jgi:hypothetical protein
MLSLPPGALSTPGTSPERARVVRPRARRPPLWRTHSSLAHASLSTRAVTAFTFTLASHAARRSADFVGAHRGGGQRQGLVTGHAHQMPLIASECDDHTHGHATPAPLYTLCVHHGSPGGGEGREPPGTHSECRTGATGSPNESRPRADPGPATGRVSPDPGASTPGRSARGAGAKGSS